jgi:hypothetical protein
MDCLDAHVQKLSPDIALLNPAQTTYQQLKPNIQLSLENKARGALTPQHLSSPKAADDNVPAESKSTGTLEEFSAMVREDAPWLADYLWTLDSMAEYIPAPKGKEKRCKVGRPKGKVLQRRHQDDFLSELCYKHKSEEDLKGAKRIHKKRYPGEKFDAFKCPEPIEPVD